MATEIPVSPIDHAAPTPGLPLQPPAAAPAAAGSTPSPGWIAATARAVGGACLRVLNSPAAGTLIFTSVCLSLVWQQRKARTPPMPVTPVPVPPVTRSMSMAMLHGGDKAIQRFELTHQASRDEAKLKAAIDDMRKELQKPDIDFVKLYACVGVAEMGGMLKEAIELLEGALKKLEEEKPSKRAHEIHELELLLAEMNIYQGEYEKALNYPCLKTDGVSSADVRVPLYRAVIYTMMDNQKLGEARQSFEMMRKIRSEFHGQKFFKEGSSMLLDVPEFDKFAKVVEKLEKEIQEARSATLAAKEQDTKEMRERETKEKTERDKKTETETKEKIEQDTKKKTEQVKEKTEQDAKKKTESDAKEKTETKEKTERDAKKKTEQVEEKTEQDAKKKTESDAKEKTETKEKTEQDAKAKTEQDTKKKTEQEKERSEQDTKEKTDGKMTPSNKK